jgi:hypothetical protein
VEKNFYGGHAFANESACPGIVNAREIASSTKQERANGFTLSVDKEREFG